VTDLTGSPTASGAEPGAAPAPSEAAPQADDLPEQMRVRRDKRMRLLAEGRDPYPVESPRTHTLAEVRERWGQLQAGDETDEVVTVAGRVMYLRSTGRLAFGTLQEGIGTRLQVMLSLAEVGKESLTEWKHLVDLGDHVFVTGRVICSKRGELSIMAASWSMAGKALRPLPVLHKHLSEEARVRQRYADLVVRQEARDMVRTKATTLATIRRVLDEQGYLEVETPILQLVHGGAAARPFRTHMNAFDQEMVLRIALELNLKKAVVGGVDRVYEMGRIFRNEGVDATHSPEFTMLEAYQAYGDQFTIARLIQDVVVGVADALGSRQV
jgi:lysyl-tRNA synthetase, class II